MWYRTGTISLTNGAAAVTGSGTNWLDDALVRVGHALVAPDGRLYEIASIQSATSLTLATPYLGSTASNQAYAIVPTQGMTRDLAQQVASLVNQYGQAQSTVMLGIFSPGSVAAPGVRFSNDTDSGLYSPGDGRVALAVNGKDAIRADRTAAAQRTTVLCGDSNASRGLALRTEGVANGEKSVVELYGTFDIAGHADKGPRRVADIVGGFSGGAWGSQYLSFRVGQDPNDAATLNPERVRIRADGRVMVNTTAPVVVNGLDVPMLSVDRAFDASATFHTWHATGRPFVTVASSNADNGPFTSGRYVGSFGFATRNAAGQLRLMSSIDGLLTAAPQTGKDYAETNIVFRLYNNDGALKSVLTVGNPTTGSFVAVDGTLRPASDNAVSCGASDRRWSQVFAANGTINTSDARLKTPVRAMTAAEIAAAKDIAREVGFFRWLDAVEKKGDAAREHCGITVQRVIEIMRGHDLDPFRYGFVCYDAIPETKRVEARQVEREVEEQTGTDENGRPIVETVTRLVDEYEEITEPARDVYSLRYEQLALFIARGLEARLTALEERL